MIKRKVAPSPLDASDNVAILLLDCTSVRALEEDIGVSGIIVASACKSVLSLSSSLFSSLLLSTLSLLSSSLLSLLSTGSLGGTFLKTFPRKGGIASTDSDA